MSGFIKLIIFSFVTIAFSAISFASETIYYTAKITNNDRYNSHGDRLYSVADILRQDRANVYKYKLADQGDERDGYFYLKNRRTIFSHAIITIANRDLAKKIVSTRRPVWVAVGYTPSKNLITVDQPD